MINWRNNKVQNLLVQSTVVKKQCFSPSLPLSILKIFLSSLCLTPFLISLLLYFSLEHITR